MTAIIDEYSRRVALHETDAAGVLYMASPVAWSQLGFENLLRACGHPLEEVIPRDLHYPIVSFSVDHHRRLTLGMGVDVRTGITRVGRRSVQLSTAILDEASGGLAARVTTTGVATSRTGREVVAEDWFRDLVCDPRDLGLEAGVNAEVGSR